MPRLLAPALALAMTYPSAAALAAPAPAPSPDPAPLEARLDPPSYANLRMGLERLGVVGSVLYVAAHPDDENTRLLAYLAGERGLRTTYVSLTRGDGGQNLVGAELGPLLGLIRTYELAAARRIDGAEQRFTRAVDFGYSKSADESLGLWGKDAVLADLVRVIREVRPDVIIARFSIDPPNHGHHTASALLAREAFAAAADPARFPEQLTTLAPHQAARLLENKSPWRFKEGEDLSRYLALDVGGRAPLTGRTWTEIAAASRTMHKSQGFGAAPALGEQLEYFEEILPGKSVPAGAKDPLAGLDFTWARYPKTEALRAAITKAVAQLEPTDPARATGDLAALRALVQGLPADHPWRARKLAELDALVAAAAGLVLDVRAPAFEAVPGEPLALDVVALSTPRAPVALASVRLPDGQELVSAPVQLGGAKPTTLKATLAVPAGAALSTPYWLRAARPPGTHLFVIPDGLDPTAPTGRPDLVATFRVTIGDAAYTFERPIRHAWVDPIHGERFRAVEVLPPVTVTPLSPVRMLPGGKAGRVEVTVKAHGGVLPRTGTVLPVAPAGWKVAAVDAGAGAFTLASAGAEATLAFDVTPPRGAGPGELTFDVSLGGAAPVRAWQRAAIAHVHVPLTTVLAPARVRAVPLDVALGGKRIGYIPGAGDEVAASLAQIGYAVTTLDPATLAEAGSPPGPREREPGGAPEARGAQLEKYDAIISGIRAYNVTPALEHAHAALMRYVERGGTYVVQYVTSNRMRALGDMPIGPWPFKIDQGRVTDERAELRWRDPKHPALTRPNRIGPDDLTGWVQERGLYFAASWDPRYTPLFDANDAGEEPLSGGTLVARHGKGAFVYTGLAFFRQLPEGVPGAYRLLANLLALGRAP